MRPTPFYEIHKQKNAKIDSFAGFLMPIQYPTGIIREHRQVRDSVGMFDLSHMGEIIVRGEKRLDFVYNLITNDASKLAVGQTLYTPMCYPDGGIVDDLLVYRMKDYFYLVVNASNIEKDFLWMKENQIEKMSLENASYDTALIAVQGPKAEEVVQKLTTLDLAKIGYYHFAFGQIAGVDVIISRTGYTGEDGFEIYFTNVDKAEEIWNLVESAGRKFDIIPIGLGARDTLRLEMKYPLYGNDIDKTTNPLEAGLRFFVKLDKDNFIGKSALVKVHQEKISRKLVAFEMLDKAVPRQHYEIYADDKKIGEVCSGTMSPSLNIGIGTGYVPREYMKTGTEIYIKVRNKMKKAIIIKPPFYKQGSVKR